MKTQQEALFHILNLLEDLAIPYMIVGSYASSYYGRPRATQDADLFLAWNPDQIQIFVKKLGPEFYADEADLKQAFQDKRISNIIHATSGFKADLSALGDSEYMLTAFKRRKKGTLLGHSAFYAAPEDVILLKLLWMRQGASARQLEDAKGILEVQENNLDKHYLNDWAAKLNLSDLLKKIAI